MYHTVTPLSDNFWHAYKYIALQLALQRCCAVAYRPSALRTHLSSGAKWDHLCSLENPSFCDNLFLT